MSKLTEKDCISLRRKRLYLLDMDGTIYLSNTLFHTTIPFLNAINQKHGKYIFITNNSSKSVKDYLLKLNNLGIKDIDESNFYTSTDCAIEILKNKYKNNQLIYAQGTKSFIAQLHDASLNITEEYNTKASCIIVGYDDELDYKKMTTTCKMLTNLNVDYYATNPDWVYPTDWGFVPDCGSMCLGYYKATGKMPIFIGKPKPTMIENLMINLKYTRDETLVIGDRLYTDIAAGNNAHVDTICVLTGESSEKDIKSAKENEKPTYMFDDLSKIPV